jgi:hypothetical protein
MAVTVLGAAVTTLLANTFVMFASAAQAQDAGAVYISDLSRCQPQEALSPQIKEGCWQFIPYETLDAGPKSGTMIGAASFVDAPDVTLPLDVTGWHSIYIGFWNPHYAYDGGTTVKVKLNDDACFLRIAEPEPGIDWNATYIKEAPFKIADLTGRTLQFGKVHGPFGQKACIAYLKLVPLSAQQVADLQADRARKETRVLEATIDGLSYFWGNEYRTREHIMELIEPYRYSDVGKVIWAVSYGDLTNYPTEVGTFWASRAIPIAFATNPYIAGEKAAYDDLRSLTEKGIIPVVAAAEHAHAMGLKFDVMFRLAITGPVPLSHLSRGAEGFVETHPQFRQVMQDGTPVEKASYAFPEVRNLMLSIIREATETFDVDGVNLCFIRGPEFMAYEQPVLDDFRKEYGEDGRKVGSDDLRMRTIRCRYLNTFVREVRETLDGVGTRKGKRLTLSTWTEAAPQNFDRGQDVEHWIQQGWLDSVISNRGPLVPKFLAAAKVRNCRCIFVGSTQPDIPKDWMNGYNLGVDGFAVWDIDGVQDLPTRWPLLRRAGHRGEIEAAAQVAPAPLPTVRLKTVGGFDVLQGLGAAVYSGG